MPPVEPLETGPALSGDLLGVRTEQLPDDLSSAGQARRVVRETLAAADRTQWIEACELATSEIVSNAVLHAHTACTLSVAVAVEHVRVEVRDSSPVLPVQRDYTAQATTGRGLALVAALTDEHGVADVGPAGKTVWFTIRGEAGQQSEEQLLDAWADADWDLVELLDARQPDDTVTTVWLLAMPTTLWLAARQHHDAIMRELVLHLAEHRDEPDVDVPAADSARAVISTAVVAAVEDLRSAAAPGAPRLDAGYPPLDLPIDVPPHLRSAFRVLRATLDVAERLARADRLLVNPGLPEIVAVRDWACEQVDAQLAGAAPSPWPGVGEDRSTTDAGGYGGAAAADEAELAAVRDSARPVVVADRANRILAVSRPLAALLGWEADDLVGRRLVALVPPQLREAHIAGFARHLATGEATILDRPLTVPVLHADGRVLTCTLLVQHLPGAAGRALYRGWIDPQVDEQ